MTGKRPSDRAFGLVFSLLFGGLALIGWLWTGGLPLWAVGISGGLLLLAGLAPGVLMPFNRSWLYLGSRIAVVSNFLLLGTFYFLVIVPYGLAARLFRLSALRKRPDGEVPSYWTPVVRQATADTYPDQF